MYVSIVNYQVEGNEFEFCLVQLITSVKSNTVRIIQKKVIILYELSMATDSSSYKFEWNSAML